MLNGILFLFTVVCAATWSASAASLTDMEKQVLLDAHNAARRAVSPTASNMQVMQWDNNIAAFAQEYAERCDFDHSSNSERSSKTGFGSDWVGENLYLTTAQLSGTSIRGAVDSWVGEKQYYTFSTGACSKEPCGHYTQVGLIVRIPLHTRLAIYNIIWIGRDLLHIMQHLYGYNCLHAGCMGHI